MGRELDLDGLEADAKVLELVIVFLQFLFSVRVGVSSPYRAVYQEGEETYK